MESEHFPHDPEGAVGGDGPRGIGLVEGDQHRLGMYLATAVRKGIQQLIVGHLLSVGLQIALTIVEEDAHVAGVSQRRTQTICPSW